MPKIKINKPLEVTAKTLKIHCKVCDNFTAELFDSDGNSLRNQDDGYVPGFMPGKHYGDYLILDIDIESGQITNWPTKVDAGELQAWVDAGSEGNED